MHWFNVNRYSNWLSSGLAARKMGTGSNPGSEWAVAAAPDDLIYVSMISLYILYDSSNSRRKVKHGDEMGCKNNPTCNTKKCWLCR